MKHAACCLLLLAPACTGLIGGGAERDVAHPAAAGAGQARGAAGSEAQRGEAIGLGAPASAGATCAMPERPPPALVRRLSNAEYEGLARSALGVAVKIVGRLIVDGVGRGFDNDADALAVTPGHLDRYAEVAAAAAAEAFATPAARMQLVGCDPTDGDRCLRPFVARFGRRVWRRPLAPEEIDSALALAKTAGNPWAGAQLVAEALLQAPSALLQIEVGEARGADASRRALSGFELASRLAFLLWRQPPDDGLLDAAAGGALDTAAGLEARARAMLEDTRGRGGLRDFGEQWIRLRQLDGVARDAKRFPQWNEALRASMKEETSRVLDDAILRGGDLLDLLGASWTFVNAPLAALYGLPAPPAGWARVELRPEDDRGGLLTQPALLTMTADDEVTTPIYRGMYVREALLCETSPPPPPEVPEPPAARPGQSTRERLREHRQSPACAGCHERLDGLGFGLERFDDVGARRARDERGQPLTGEGRLVGFDPPRFVGARELAARLRAAPALATCVVRQLYRYAFASRPSDGQACALGRLEVRFHAEHHDLRKVVLALVGSDTFRFVASAVGGTP